MLKLTFREHEISRSLIFPQVAELWNILLLDTNGKSYMGSTVAVSFDLEMSNQQ